MRIEDRATITERLRRSPPSVSELTFTNLYAWSGARPVWVAELGEALLFLVHPRENTDHFCVLGPPVGPWPGAQRVAEVVPGLEGWLRVDAATVERLRTEGLDVAEDADNADYVYSVADLVALSGPALHAKQNQVRQCLDAYACEFTRVTSAFEVAECLDVQARWCQARDCGRNPGLCRENEAVRVTMEHFLEFGLLGGLIRIDGVAQAFAVAETLAPGTAVWHFEKAMPQFRGLGPLLTHWFAANVLRDFEFVNREQDLGLPGLRQAKRSWSPHHRVAKFSACYGASVSLEPLPVCGGEG